MKLKGRYAVVTGASRGLGKSIAKQFLIEGASVMLCARDAEALQDTQKELSALLNDDQALFAQRADVSQISQVNRLVKNTLAKFPRVDILVNNAGIYGPKGLLEEADWKEWVKTVQINLLGVVCVSRAFLPNFKKHRHGKIINLSGGGATHPLPRLSAYATSKAAVVRFTETLAEELRDFGIDVNAIAPGALNTRLLDEVLEAGPEKVGHDFYDKAKKQKKEGGTALNKGASLCVFLASGESDGITGKLISAVWDPWPDLKKFKTDIHGTDIYTLRRIVPKDRGKTWGEP